LTIVQNWSTVRAHDPLRLSVPLHEHREDEAPDLPSVRNQRILPRQAGDGRGDARREVGTEAETVSHLPDWALILVMAICAGLFVVGVVTLMDAFGCRRKR
jgi:hypothetical protein